MTNICLSNQLVISEIRKYFHAGFVSIRKKMLLEFWQNVSEIIS